MKPPLSRSLLPAVRRARLAGLAGLAGVACAVLVACGGSSGSDAPAADAMTVNGTITGFGSVIIDGVRFDDSAAAVAVDQGAAAPSNATLSDLKLGMNVDARIEGGRLKDVVVRAKLDGPVASIDLAGARFVVWGQTVKVVTTGATPTMFEGVADLAGLAVGDRVEVHGPVDASRAITATRVERKPSNEVAGAVRIGGVVAQNNAGAKTFHFNDLTVDYANATITPEGRTPTDGQLAVAFGDAVPSAGRFVAKALRLVAADDGQAFGIGGRVGSYTSLADFVVSGVRVDASEAALEGGVAADLAVGVPVGVEGRMVAGELKATKLRIFKAPADVAASLKGQVSDFVSAASFKLRETPVDASTATFVGGTAGDLGNGAWIVASGKAQGDVFKAERVEFVNPPAALPVKLSGEMRDWNAEARTFKLMGMSARLATNAEFVGGQLAQLVNGRRIEVLGLPGADGVVVVTRVAFLAELAPPRAAIAGGRIYDAADRAFKLPGINVTYTADTVVEGGNAAALANGVQVLAMGAMNGQTRTLAATWIQIIPAEQSGPRIAGTVSGFVSLGEFRIGEQRIDASAATLSGGTAADLANGSIVVASGPMVERAGVRLMAASQLRILLK